MILRNISNLFKYKRNFQQFPPLSSLSSSISYVSISFKSFSSSSSSSTLNEIKLKRINKINQMKENKIESYQYNYKINQTISQLHQKYSYLKPGEEEKQDNNYENNENNESNSNNYENNKLISIAGRIMVRRFFGKLAFFELKDHTGTIQLYIDKGRLKNEFTNIQNWSDNGDIIGVTGTMKRTEKGELSVYVSTWTMLTKSLLPLPDKFHGLTDIDTRYRNRHLDMIVNDEVILTLKKRALIIQTIRSYLDDLKYIEVETPVLITHAGGADAEPFLTYHNSLDMKLSLRIATELHLKRLIVGGIPRVYEIGRIFRNEGLSTRHNPEFTSIELYESYADYNTMMLRTEDIISNSIQKLCAIYPKDPLLGNLKDDVYHIKYQDYDIDMTPPYKRISMHDCVFEYTGINFDDYYVEDQTNESAIQQSIENVLNEIKKKSNLLSSSSLSHILTLKSLDEIMVYLFEEVCESKLIQPTFVTHHPIITSPLAKLHREEDLRKRQLVERFELYIMGREIANAYSELTDPIDQRNRFEKQLINKDDNKEIDEEFLNAIETGMPPTGGLGIGIDRLVMLLTNSSTIKDVIAFPLLRKES